MTAAAAIAISTSSDDILSPRVSTTAGENSSLGVRGWMARAIPQLKELAPYAALELILPGGSLMAILLWVYRRGQSRRCPSTHCDLSARALDKLMRYFFLARNSTEEHTK